MGLISKLAEVMAAVERVPKRGRNAFHGYDYATEADIVSTVRQELATRQIMLFPQVNEVTREPVGEKGQVLTTLSMSFTFIDGETGESQARDWAGAGTDKEDKGLYKAMTGGEKYFLLKTFLMPTGDDPEVDEKLPAKGYVVGAPSHAGAEYLPEPVRRPDPPAAVNSGQLTIKSVRVNPTKNANVKKAVIVLSDGRQVQTIKDKLIALCEQLQQEGAPVDVQTKTTEKWGEELTNVSRALPEIQIHADHGQPVSADEVPF